MLAALSDIPCRGHSFDDSTVRLPPIFLGHFPILSGRKPAAFKLLARHLKRELVCPEILVIF